MDVSLLHQDIGPYHIDERLKAGGVAVVFRATDTRTGDPVAFKVLQTSWAEHEDVQERFLREAHIMQKLDHPHIVRYLDTGVHEGRSYIVMEFMPGGSLSDRLKRITQINLGGSVRLLAQMATALDYAHSQNVVHRDLKPGNILMRDDEHAALTDFGIARMLKHTLLTNWNTLTTAGNMPGTPHYMSPEQAKGDEDVGTSSDLYSLAIISYLLTVGSLPFGGVDPIVILNQHISMDPPLPSERNPELPPTIDQVLLRGLAKEPSRRYRTSRQFVRALLEAIDGYESLVVSLRTNRDVNLPLDDVSRVFSSLAHMPDLTDIVPPPEPEPPLTTIDREAHTEVTLSARDRNLRRGRSPLVVGVVVIALVLAGVLFLLAGGDEQPSVAVLPTATETLTATVTLSLTTTPTATSTPSATETRLPTDTDVPVDAEAVTQSTDERPPTETNTPRPTLTPSITPSVTPTPPPFNGPDDALSGLDPDTPASRFDCVGFLEAYRFIEDAVEQGTPEYEPLRGVVENRNSPARQIFDLYCRDNPDEDALFIDVPALVQEMRNQINTLQRRP